MKRCSTLVCVIATLTLTACGSSSALSPAFIRRATAALGSGPIIHAVWAEPTGAVNVNLRTGKSTPSEGMRGAIWTTMSGSRVHIVESNAHRVVGDLLLPQDAARMKRAGPVATGWTSLVSFWASFRALLRSPDLEAPSRGTFDGRPVLWLRFKPTAPTAEIPHPPTQALALDAHSYEPVDFRLAGLGVPFDERILVFKSIPYRPSDFRREGPSLLSRANLNGPTSWDEGVAGHVPLTTRGAVRRPPWLSAGKTAGGLELHIAHWLWARPKRGPTVHGVELVYGYARYGPESLTPTTVDELPKGDPADGWNSIPPGSIKLESATSGGNEPGDTEWTGYMKKDKLYITIDTIRGRRALLAIARHLTRSHG
jgi:hypothetical protein